MRARTFIWLPGGVPERVALPALTCEAGTAGAPPIPLDRLSAPTGDDLLPQIVAEAPRGRAWQSDETHAPIGSTVQHGVWGVIADALAASYGLLWRATMAAFPSAADADAIADWEGDYGLPDPCLGDLPTLDLRRQSVRAALVAPDDASRRGLICALAALGYTVEVDEWDGFECGASGCAETGLGSLELSYAVFVNIVGGVLTWLECGAVGLGEDGLGTVVSDAAICVVQSWRHSHVAVHYSIDGVPV